MKKTFLTSKSKEELIKELKELKKNYAKYKYDKEMIFVRVEDVNKILVSSGRDWGRWKLNLDISGEITVEKGFTITEYILLFFFIALDVFLFFLFLYVDGSFMSILTVLELAGIEFLLYYSLYIFFPMKSIKRFVNKYLGGIS